MSLEHFTMDPRLPVDEIVDLQELWDSDSFVSRHGILEEPSSIEGWPCMNTILAQDEMEDMEFKSVIVLRDRLMTDAAYCTDLQTENAAFTPLTENHQLCHSSQQRTCPLEENHHKNHTEECEIAAISEHEHTRRHSHNPRENKETSRGPISVTLLPLHIKTEPLSQPGSPQSEPGHNVTMTPLLSTTAPSMPMELSSHGQANTSMEYPYLIPKANVFTTANAVTCHYAQRDRSNSPSVLSKFQSSSLFMSKMMDNNGSNALSNASSFVPGANQASRSNLNDMAFTQLNVKMEPQARGAFLPPTPPSSNTSDCEGGFSPIRDRESASQLHSVNDLSAKGFLLSVSNAGYHSRHPIISPQISSQPKSGSGTIYLTEEEKRSLIAEGYPVPVKFPLTKVEEKSLKKIRRKIKNKISAQESRRKKKEYLDALERRSDMLAAENMEFRRRVMELESTNVSLQNQLRNLEDSLNQLHKMDKNRSTALSMVTTSAAIN